MRNTKIICLLAAISGLSGCSVVSKMSPSEKTWQALNAIDMAQTDVISRNPSCFHERAPITKDLIGRHPSRESAAAIGVVYAIGHYAASRWLDRKSDSESGKFWGRARLTWRAVSLAYKAGLVVNNHRLGVRVGGGSARCERPAPGFDPDARPIR